jgi:hypothetical protein
VHNQERSVKRMVAAGSISDSSTGATLLPEGLDKVFLDPGYVIEPGLFQEAFVVQK